MTLAERLAAIRAGHDAAPVAVTPPAGEIAPKALRAATEPQLTVEERLAAIEARLTAAFGNKV